MFILNKKEVLKMVGKPLSLKSTDKKNRFTRFSEEKLEKIMNSVDEWASLTRTYDRDKYVGVIPFLAGKSSAVNEVLNILKMLL